MDNGFATEDGPAATLSYDDTVPYEHQLPAVQESNAPSLANRIGSTKVYLLSEASSTATRLGKKKQHDDTEYNGDDNGEREAEDEMDTDQDPSLRANAILLHGPPIAHLPTARLFEYAAHFDVHPLGLEWIDDNTCIFVFSSKSTARSAFLALRKPNATSSSSSDTVINTYTADLTTARAIPVSLWPPEDRIHHSLGVGQGLKGTMLMRWAQTDDQKKRGAKKDSEFYKKHGLDAGKESAGFGVVPASVAAGSENQGSLARRMGQIGETLEERIAVGEEEEEEDSERPETEGVREWDRGKPGITSLMLEKRISSSTSMGKKRKRMRNDIDEFLGEDLVGSNDMPLVEEEVDPKNSAAHESMDGGVVPDSPPSKMRSDYIAKDGRTVIGSANGKKAHGLVDRITAPLPRRARGGHRSGKDGFRNVEGDENRSSPQLYEDGGRKQRGGRRRGRDNGPLGGPSEQPRKKTRQELDDELEAFLNSKT